ncbi:MAG: DUF4838 domain-containing protein [Planctomycetota bacterium]
MWIVKDGKAYIGIDVLPDAAEPIKYAGEQLKHFINRKTSCVLPDSVCDGFSIILRLAGDDRKYSEALAGVKKAETYMVDADEKNIYLVGIDPAAVVYAVFDFLSTECDIGFGGLGELGVRLNITRNLGVNVQKRICSPDFTYRGLQCCIIEDGVDVAGGISPLHLKRLDWMVQNRMNYIIADPGPAIVNYITYAKDEGSFDNIRRFIPHAKKRGLKVQWGHHCWKRWLPPSKYYEKHPEYYSLINGKRVRENLQQLCFCTSNPDVAKVMADEIMAVLAEFPDIEVISAWPEDGFSVCECDNCKAMDNFPAGYEFDYIKGTDKKYSRSYRDRNKTIRLVKFLNQVAEIVGKSYPKVRLTESFYFDVDAPPAGVELADNIEPNLAHYWRCWRHPLDHPNCDNGYYNRITEEWAKLYPDRLVIYEYPMGMSCYSSFPWPILPTMHNDWKRFKDLRIAGATLQSQSSHFTVYGPNYAAFAKMSWDTKLPTASLTANYYFDLYQEASEPVRTMFETLEKRYIREDCEPEFVEFMDYFYDERFPHCLMPSPNTITRVLDEKTFATIDICLARAHSLASQDRTRLNLEKLQIAVDYWKLGWQFYTQLGKIRIAVQEKSPQTPAEIEKGIEICEKIILFVEKIPYEDVISKSMVLISYWPKQLKSLFERRKNPFIPHESIGKWP